ncbi:MAG: HAD family hydrolase [Anaerolineae bacterium]
MMERGRRMLPYSVILLDAGGTLLVRQPSNAEVLAKRCAAAGIDVVSAAAHHAWKQAEAWACQQVLREMNGAPRMPDAELDRQMTIVAARSLLGDSGAAAAGAASRLQTTERPTQAWRPMPGVERTLAHLTGGGYRLAVVSNFDASLPDLLSHLGLLGYFEAVIVSAQVGLEKPDPGILRLACERLGVDCVRALYVGDHPLDVLCAKAAGMAVAWVCEGEERLPAAVLHQPDYRIASANDLVGLTAA